MAEACIGCEKPSWYIFHRSLKVIPRWAERPCERGNAATILRRAEVSSFLSVSFSTSSIFIVFLFPAFHLPPSLHHWVVRTDVVDVTWLQWNVTSRNLLSDLIGLHCSGQAVNKDDGTLIGAGDFSSFLYFPPSLSLSRFSIFPTNFFGWKDWSANVYPTSLPKSHKHWCCCDVAVSKSGRL